MLMKTNLYGLFMIKYLLPFTLLFSSAKLIPRAQISTPCYVNTQAPKGGHIKIGFIGSHTVFSLNPPGTSLVYEPLVEATKNPLIFHPLLADIVFSTNQTALLTLHPQTTFSDHSKITTDAIIESFNQVAPSLKGTLDEALLSISKVSSQTLNIQFNCSQNQLLQTLSTIPIKSASGIGSGPYLLSKTSTNEIHYIKNNHYWGETLDQYKGYFNIETIAYHRYPSTFHAHMAFEKKDISTYIENTAARWHHIKTKKNYHEVKSENRKFTQIFWIRPRYPFDDPILRAIIADILNPSIASKRIYFSEYLAVGSSKLSVNQTLSSAADSLDQAGWLMTNGKRYKNNMPLSLTIIAQHHMRPLMTLYTELFTRLGIDIKITYHTKTTYDHLLKQEQYDVALDQFIEHTNFMNLAPSFINHLNHKPILHAAYKTSNNHPLLAEHIKKHTLQTLIDNHLIVPLWSMNKQNFGAHHNVHYQFCDHMEKDIRTWWVDI